MKKYLAAVVASYILLSATALAIDPPESIVFDSLQPPGGGGHGFTSGITEIGLGVTLSGEARHISQFDVFLQGFPRYEYRVRFYELDNRTGQPANIIWESPIQRNDLHMATVDVPNVLVPDSFVFTIAPLMPLASHIALETSLGPTIGTHDILG